jgi:hypothetical protein
MVASVPPSPQQELCNARHQVLLQDLQDLQDFQEDLQGDHQDWRMTVWT